MQNPFQPGADAQSAMNDPLNFIRKLWGDMQLPGMVTPTISVDELDKQIKDLKTVESWLNVNMNMLRGTIQALEVQRATITALKAMGESFAQNTGARPAATPSQSENQHAQWPMHQHADTVSEAQADAENQEQDDEEVEQEDVREAAGNASSSNSEQTQTSSANAGASEASNAYSNPAAWWNVLQDQFKQALGNALKDEAPAEESATKPNPSKAKAPRVSRVAKSKAAATPAKSAKAKPSQAAKTVSKAPVAKKTVTKAAASKATKRAVKR